MAFRAVALCLLLAWATSQAARKRSGRQSVGACSGSPTLISAARDQLYATVTVRGVVTAVLPGLYGYYIQEASGGDGDAATSDGIFVFDRSPVVQQGQLIEMSAYVSSYYGNMQLTPRSAPEVCASDVALPAPVVLDQLPTNSEASSVFGSLQGMLITVPAATVTDIYNLQRYGEVRLSTTGRLTSPSQIYDPLSSEHDALLASYRDTLVLAYGSSAQNPDPIPFPGDGLSWENYIRSGDIMQNVTGPLGYRFSKNLVDKTPGLPSPVYVRSNPRQQAPPDVGGRLKVSCFNVLNYFNGPPLGLPFSDSNNRGASSELEFGRQRDKIVSAMVALDAAVFVLNEMENNGNLGQSAVSDLVNGLNAATSSGRYATVALPSRVGTDAISSNFIFQPALVEVVGNLAILDSSVDPLFIDTKNRPSIAITFGELSSGNQFTVVANHLKSKGSSCADVGDPESPGAGNCDGVRTNASRALGRWLQTYPTGISTDDVLITGDMNSYHAESPIQTLIQDFGYVDMVDRFNSKETAYSYVYSGYGGYLDHALASSSLASKIANVADWHINADESGAFDYTTSYKSSGQIDEYYRPEPYRSSDHDPLLVGLFG